MKKKIIRWCIIAVAYYSGATVYLFGSSVVHYVAAAMVGVLATLYANSDI